jgi:cytochrome P450
MAQNTGYFIPEGTIAQPNVWYGASVERFRHDCNGSLSILSRALSRNEAMFPDSDKFQPERFLSVNKFGETPIDPLKFVFGFGRR